MLCIAVVVVGLLGCPDKNLRESIHAHQRGIQLVKEGNYGSAVANFKDAVRFKDSNDVSWYELGKVLAAQARTLKSDPPAAKRKWNEAAGAFRNAAKNKPDQSMYFLKLGIAHYNGGHIDKAEPSLEKALQLNPKLYRAQYYMGKIRQDQERPKDAAEFWNQAAENNPEFGNSFAELGKLYIDWDELDAAIAALRQGKHAKDDGVVTVIQYYLGFANELQGQTGPAIAAYTASVEARAENALAQYRRGLVYANIGDRTKALEDLEGALKSGKLKGGQRSNAQRKKFEIQATL